MKKNKADAVRKLAEDIEARVYENYSGRCMFGKKCIGVVVRCVDDVLSVYKKYKLPKPSYDSLGLDCIVYWPSIEG